MVTTTRFVLRDTTGDCDPIHNGCRWGLPHFPIFYKKSIVVIADFCHGHRVTSSLAVLSRGHRQFSAAVTWSPAV